MSTSDAPRRRVAPEDVRGPARNDFNAPRISSSTAMARFGAVPRVANRRRGGERSQQFRIPLGEGTSRSVRTGTGSGAYSHSRRSQDETRRERTPVKESRDRDPLIRIVLLQCLADCLPGRTTNLLKPINTAPMARVGHRLARARQFPTIAS